MKSDQRIKIDFHERKGLVGRTKDYTEIGHKAYFPNDTAKVRWGCCTQSVGSLSGLQLQESKILRCVKTSQNIKCVIGV